MASERLNVALIGATGKVAAPAHLNGLSAAPNANLYAVCDIDADTVGELAEATGSKAFTSLEAVLADMNPRAQITRLEYGNLAESFLSGIEHQIMRGDPLTEPPDPVFAESFKSDNTIDRDAFENALTELGDHLLRLKGQVDFGNGPEFFEYAGGILRTSDDKSIRRIAKTPTAFIAIGWRIRQTEFRAAIEVSL